MTLERNWTPKNVISPLALDSDKGDSTYTTIPSSTKSVLEGKIGLPSVPRAGSMLAAHSIDAMVMNKALFVTFIPRQIRRPKPWRTLIFD